jgi:2-C-methyl-D-erythritol 4-phosphate cytidylyltransferase/2-C-methyl-D-erythritol 2,4-cyclodiphosphate synthase
VICMDKLTVIVPAAGAGKRLGLGKNKVFAMLGGLPLLVQCLRMINDTGMADKTIIAAGAAEIDAINEMLARYRDFFPLLDTAVVTGGAERTDSVKNALALTGSGGFIAVHDGARPFAGKEVFERTLKAAVKYGAAIAALPVKNTIKLIDENGFVAGTPQRSLLRAVQTPQIFKAELLHRAYLRGAAVTDDASLVERLGVKVAVAEGSYENIKITTPEDLLLAEKICADRGMAMQQEIKVPQFRVGTGFDVHRLTENRKLILCGGEVPYELGLDGHSDADVAVHALMDALLGAAALGDIGRHFPDTDERFKGADSMKLLAHVIALLKERCWHVNNADVTIIAQRPKLAGFIPQMRANLAAALELGEDAVNVKATTTEKLGFTGRGEGIAAEACVSLIKI